MSRIRSVSRYQASVSNSTRFAPKFFVQRKS